MSGPAIHHITAAIFLEQQLKNAANPAGPPNVREVQFLQSIASGKLSSFYNLGAQGPDYLFFNSMDWIHGGSVKPLAKAYLEIAEFMEEFKQKLKSLIPPEVWALIAELEAIVDDIEKRSVLLTQISELTAAVQDNINVLKAMLEAKLEEVMTDYLNVFDLLTHPQQGSSGFTNSFDRWWWMDTMHLRRSGRFLKELLVNSAEGSPERAYALGYLTHYATDTVGHPFVNAICGGPYRTHAQRHKVVENHQDVWAYNEYIGGELTNSNLAARYVIGGDAYHLPDDLKKYLLKCIQNTYYGGNGPLYGANIKGDDLDISYSLWLKWFTMTTNDEGLPMPAAYSVTAEVADALDKFLDNAGDVFASPGSASGGGGVVGFFKGILAALAAPFLLALAAVDFVLGTITALGAAPIRYLLSLSYEALYNAYMNMRAGLVAYGMFFPQVSELNNPLTQHMLNSGLHDRFRHNASSLPDAGVYPAKKFAPVGMEREAHLVYPYPTPAVLEKDATVGFPDSYRSKTARWYIDDPGNALNEDYYQNYRAFAETAYLTPGGGSSGAGTLDANYHRLARLASVGGLGNAVAFSQRLYQEYRRYDQKVEFPDYCLDSDRGYGFKSWRKVADPSLINSASNDPDKINVPIYLDEKVPNAQTDILYPNGGAL